MDREKCRNEAPKPDTSGNGCLLPTEAWKQSHIHLYFTLMDMVNRMQLHYDVKPEPSICLLSEAEAKSLFLNAAHKLGIVPTSVKDNKVINTLFGAWMPSYLFGGFHDIIGATSLLFDFNRYADKAKAVRCAESLYLLSMNRLAPDECKIADIIIDLMNPEPLIHNMDKELEYLRGPRAPDVDVETVNPDDE